MAIIANNKGGGERTLAPVGNHIARCVQMIHIGTSEDEIMGKTEIGKWEIAHSNLDIEEVIENKTSIKSIRIVKKLLSL